MNTLWADDPYNPNRGKIEMLENDMKKAAGFLLAGAVVGAGVALLYAPQSGVRTQKDIRRFARRTADRLDDLQMDIRDRMTDWVDEMAEAIEFRLDKGKTLGAAGCAQVRQSFENAKQCVDEGRLRIERMIAKETA